MYCQMRMQHKIRNEKYNERQTIITFWREIRKFKSEGWIQNRSWCYGSFAKQGNGMDKVQKFEATLVIGLEVDRQFQRIQ